MLDRILAPFTGVYGLIAGRIVIAPRKRGVSTTAKVFFHSPSELGYFLISKHSKGVHPMPIELVWIGGVLVVAAGILMFAVINRHKSAEPPHFR